MNAPRTPAFNKIVDDKHSFFRDLESLSDDQIDEIDDIFRKRMGALMSVDDLYERLVGVLKKAGVWDNTVSS